MNVVNSEKRKHKYYKTVDNRNVSDTYVNLGENVITCFCLCLAFFKDLLLYQISVKPFVT